MRELERSESGGWLQVVRILLVGSHSSSFFGKNNIRKLAWEEPWCPRRLLLQQYSDDGLFGALLSICSQGGLAVSIWV